MRLVDALVFEDLLEIIARDEDADGSRVFRRLRAVLDPFVHHVRGVVAVLFGLEQGGSEKPGRLRLGEFVDAVGTVDADSDDIVRGKSATFGRANAAEHGAVVQSANEPALHFGMLHQQDIYRFDGGLLIGWSFAGL